MKNKDKFVKFYESIDNPLTDKNLGFFVDLWQKTSDNKVLLDKITENNYPNFNCSSDLVNNDFLVLADKKDRYYFGKDKFYQNLDDYKKDIKHQLFIGAGYKMQDIVVNNFINLCHNNEIPFYIKTSSEKKKDNVVIYTTDSNFFDCLEILNHMSVDLLSRNEMLKKIYMPFITGLFEPSILTSKCCSWVGYGSKANDDYMQSRIDFLDENISKIIEKDTKVNKEILQYLRKYLISESHKYNIDSDNMAFNDDITKEIKVLKK